MRRPRAKSETNVSLFPFLAVLLCTMGALIVILVVLSHQARASATRARQQQAAAQDEEAELARDELQWQIEQLSAAREQTAKDLEQERLRLSHVEDHMRRLRDERQRLLTAANALRQTDDASAGKRQEVEQQLARIQNEIAQLSEQLKTAHRRAANGRPTYSIVPYEGPNGTRRRPIFIECRADTVVLQPEGVVLTPDDFDEPVGPGNPLATAVRAAREYLMRSAPPGSDVEPYPLLLVRPDGVLAYYQARRAIESWGPDFGYQLIDADWKLDFPQTDPHLAEIERRAVEQGRQLQQRLRAAAPGVYGRRRPNHRAARRGGGGRDGGLGAGGSGAGNGAGNAMAGGRGGRSGASGYGASAHGGSHTNASTAGQLAQGYGTSRNGHGEANAGAGRGPGTGTGRGGGPGGPNPSQTSGGPSFGQENALRSQAHQATGNGPNPGAGQTNGGPNGHHATSAADTHQQAFAPGQAAARGDSAGASGQPSSATAGQAGAGQAGGGSGRQQGNSSGGSSGGQSGGGQSGGNVGRSFGQQKSGAKGRNWALKDATRSSVPIRRPLRVFCREDRFVIAEDRDYRNGRQVAVVGPTENAIDDFVDTLWEQMEGWGIAGNGLHWKPELIMQVGPGGAGRAEDLTRLLEGSGVETRYDQQAQP